MVVILICFLKDVPLTRVYGGLSDQDRIFQNLYGEGDWALRDAFKRVNLF